MGLVKDLIFALIFAIVAIYIIEGLPICTNITVYQHNLTTTNEDKCDHNCKLNIKLEENNPNTKAGINEGQLIRRKLTEDAENAKFCIYGIKGLNIEPEFNTKISTVLEDYHLFADKDIEIPVINKTCCNNNTKVRINNKTWTNDTILCFNWSGPIYNKINSGYYEYKFTDQASGSIIFDITEYTRNSAEIDCTEPNAFQNMKPEGDYSFSVRSYNKGIMGPYSYYDVSIDLKPPTLSKIEDIVVKKDKSSSSSSVFEISDLGSGIQNYGIQKYLDNSWRHLEGSRIIELDNRSNITNKAGVIYHSELNDGAYRLWSRDNCNNTGLGDSFSVIVSDSEKTEPTNKYIYVYLDKPKNNTMYISKNHTLTWDCRSNKIYDIRYKVLISTENFAFDPIPTEETYLSLSSLPLSANQTYDWYVKAEGGGIFSKSLTYKFTTAKDLKMPEISSINPKKVFRPEDVINVIVKDENGVKWLNYTIPNATPLISSYMDINGKRSRNISINIPTSHMDKGKNYIYMSATDIFGNINNISDILIVGNVPPNKPKDLQPSNVGVDPHEIALKWWCEDPDKEDILNYVIYLSKTSDGSTNVDYSPNISKTGPYHTYIIPSGLTYDEDLTWWVKVTDGEYNIPSDKANFTTIKDTSPPSILINSHSKAFDQIYSYKFNLNIDVVENESQIKTVYYTIKEAETGKDITNESIDSSTSYGTWNKTHNFDNSNIEYYKNYKLTIHAVNSVGKESRLSMNFMKLPPRIILNCTGCNMNKAEKMSGNWSDTNTEEGSHIWHNEHKNEIIYSFTLNKLIPIDKVDGLEFHTHFKTSYNDDRAEPKIVINIIHNNINVGSLTDWYPYEAEKIIDIGDIDLTKDDEFKVTYYLEYGIEGGVTVEIIRHWIVVYLDTA